MGSASTPFFGTLSNFDHQQQDWITYRSRIQQWFIANDFSETTDKAGLKRRAILLSALNENSYQLASNLVLPKDLDTVSYDDIVRALDVHFTPKRCGFAERHHFYAAVQRPNESHAHWAARLRGLAAHCNFKVMEDALLDKFVMGMLPGPEREKLFAMEISELTLAKAVDLAEGVRCARAAAASTSAGGSGDPLFKIENKGLKSNNDRSASKCSVCGRKNHKSNECRFSNYKCKKCNVKGHLRRMCNKINYVESGEVSEGDDGEFFNIRCKNGAPMTEIVSINNVQLKFEVDSGSTVTAISDKTYYSLFARGYSQQTTKNAPNQEPVYRKVAIVENFFDIIYTVHVELEGRPGKHAGQKRTYRTITETYAFLPREAVTRFLTGCAECARRPRSASPPPLPTPSPSPTRHPPFLPFLPQTATDYTRNWESEIDAAHSTYPYEPKFDYTDLQPLKKVESPKTADAEDQEPTYIELTSKKVNGFNVTPLFSRNSPVEPAFREEEPVRTDPEIDKDENSLIDVEDVKIDSPPPLVLKMGEEDTKNHEIESTNATEIAGVTENQTEVKEKKYNPLDVANLTSKDPPKSRSPPRKKLLPSSTEYSNSFGRTPKPWRPDGGMFYGGEEMDYSVPITTAYLKHMRSMAFQERMDMELKDNLTPEPSDMNDDDNFSSQAIAKDAEKLKMMLLAWNYHSQTQAGRNGDITESGADSMADLWASYHSALGLGSKPPKAPTPLTTGHSSPIHVGSVTPGVEPASTHDETSSSDRTKDDDDAGASDDDSDDRVDPQHHDPERLKAFNMFVRLFVDENLDRIVPISKQPKEKIQAIIDSCTRQFPEFAERARKRIRTYLKSCRRNKKVRGEGPTSGNGGSTPGTGNAWDTAVRPTPAHLTSVQAEHILAQACENESLNAKRMRLGLDPVSQPMPTVPTPMAIDTTATSAVASSFLSLYSGAISSPASTPATTSTTSSLAAAGHSKVPADTTRPSASPTLENSLLNNNNLKLDNANGNTGSKTASPASSPAPLFRPSFPTTFGTPQTFGRQNSNTNTGTALSSSALLSTLSALPPSGVGVNAAMAAYQSALLSAMAAHTHTFPSSISAPTDLSLKNPATSSALHATSTVSSLTGSASSQPSKAPLLTHKLSGAEVGAVRQLITGYRESAAFLLRSADELEALLLNQP